MDQILAIPHGRKRHNQAMLCSIMALTVLLAMAYVNRQVMFVSPLTMEQPAAAISATISAAPTGPAVGS